MERQGEGREGVSKPFPRDLERCECEGGIDIVGPHHTRERKLTASNDSPGDGPGGLSAWSFQSCSETLHLFSSATKARSPKARGIREYSFDIDSQKKLCSKLWGAGQVPDPHHLAHEFGGYAISRKPGVISNVIWSNGG